MPTKRREADGMAKALLAMPVRDPAHTSRNLADARVRDPVHTSRNLASRVAQPARAAAPRFVQHEITIT